VGLKCGTKKMDTVSTVSSPAAGADASGEEGANGGDQVNALTQAHHADVLAHVNYNKDATGSITEKMSLVTLAATPTPEEIEHYTRSLESPGEIQSHGWLLLVDEAENCIIRAATDNVLSLFGVPAEQVLGRYFGSLFVERERIDSAVAMSDLRLSNPVNVTLVPSAGAAGEKKRKVNLILTRSRSGLLVDIEEVDMADMGSFSAHQRVRLTIGALNNHTDLVTMSQQVVEQVAQTTGHTRVMMYKFHEDMHGEVIAECKSPEEEGSWLGLHFPATDLPQRSRDQLAEEHVRLIADARAQPAKIVTDATLDRLGGRDSVDLKGSTLRSPHRCHREYLANMDVRGTLVLAVLIKDHLWGLVVCHHPKSRSVSYQTRMACEFLAQALSMRLSSLMDMKVHSRHEHTLQLHAKLCEFMYKHGPSSRERLQGLVSYTPNLSHLFTGSGWGAVVFEGHVLPVIADGQNAPKEEHLLKLYHILEQGKKEKVSAGAKTNHAKGGGGGGRVVDKMEVVVVNSLVQDFGPEFAVMGPQICGMVAVKALPHGWLLFLRPEVTQTIHWSGDPRQAASRTTVQGTSENGGKSQSTSILGPRASFDTYTDSVKARCQPWLETEVQDASGLGRLVKDLVSHEGRDELPPNVLVQLNSERLQTRNANEAALTEMRFLIDSVKAPVLGMDHMGRLVQWNAMLAQLTGYAREDVVGLSIDNYVPNGLRAPLKDAVRRAIKGQEVEGVELTIIKANAVSLAANQRRVDLRVNVSARFNEQGKCTGVVCVGLDVTATNAARGRRAELEQQMDAVLHMTSDTLGATEEVPECNFTFETDKETAFLGEGTFAKTYKMRGAMDDQLYAVKMINVKKAEKCGIALDGLKREVHMLMRLNSAYIIRYYTCYMHRKSKYFCIVMELAEGGSLGDLIEDTRGTVSRLSEARARMIVTQLTKGIEHIHSRRMLHRDIKPHNILLTTDGSEAKITDFGLACLMSSAAANSRAGTLAYSSAEKAGARGYDTKDDMWAVGCILSELLTNTPIPSRCEGGVFAFSPALIQKTVEDSIKISAHLGRIVAQLLVMEPERRPTASELLAMLEPMPSGGLDFEDAEELCEEYLCAICQNLVLDAHTVCQDEHVFCGECLSKWLANKSQCPTCRKDAAPPHRLRIINNAVEKLANRVLDTKSKHDRNMRKDALKAAVAAREKASAQRAAAHAAALVQPSESASAPPMAVHHAWKYSLGQAQFGAGCTVFKHVTSGLILEVFHANGWYRFRTQVPGPTRWCNSCGNLGQSDFGAAHAVTLLQEGGGQDMPEDALNLFDDSGYWLSRVSDGRIVLSNSDEETLYLAASGAFVWLSHPGISRGVVIQNGVCSSVDRSEATALLV